MKLIMNIEQGDNGWILTFTGHDLLQKCVICKTWEELQTEIDKYFGWYDLNGKHFKKTHIESVSFFE